MLNSDGSFAGALLTDISERKAAQRQVLAQREWFRVTLQSIGDAVIATDATGNIDFMNPIAEELTGWRAEDARGRPLDVVFRIVNEETRQPVENPVTKVLREKRVVGLANHTALIARDGSERPIDDSGAPIRDADGNIVGVILVFRDNTARAHAEKALRAADRRKDEVLALLAHELRNPLAPIRSALDIMKLADEQAASRDRARAIVERQIDHMTRLVDDLLDVSRITQGKIALRTGPVDVRSTVTRAVEIASPMVERRKQRVVVRMGEEPVVVHGDATRLAQVVSNLLNNAAKFSPDDSEISVSVEAAGERASVRVRDQGCGIRAEELDLVFEPFRQSSAVPESARGGLGLGLTLVKNLVEMHRGRAWAHSEGPGRGSEFVIELPIVAAKTEQPPAAERRIAQLGRRRFFIVDDNADAADLIMTGHEVAARLRGEPSLAGLKIIALTGYGQDSDRRRTRDGGFDDHLVKPVAVDTLRAVLSRVLDDSGTPRAAE